MFAHFRSPLSWTEVGRRSLAEIVDDNCLGLAAQLAFYFLMALFPALLFFVALLGFLPINNVLPELITALSTVAPQALIQLVQGQLAQLAMGESVSLLTVGIAGAVWSSSAAMVSIIDALNRAYDVSEWRPWWRRRLVAIGLTAVIAIFVVLSMTLVLVGPVVAERLTRWLGLAPIVADIWALVRWPVIIGCAVLGLDLVYFFAPYRHVRWTWLTPGALLGTALWVGISFGFKFYVTNITDYAATYGAIGGAIVTMLWFYLSGLAVLIGAELNGVLEQTRRTEP